MDILKGRRGPALPAVAFGSLVALGLSLFAAPAAAQARRGCEVSHPPGFGPRKDEVRNCNPDYWTPDDRRFFGFNPLRAYVASSSRWEVDGSPAHYGPNGFQVTLSVYCKEPVWMEWENRGRNGDRASRLCGGLGCDVRVPAENGSGKMLRGDQG